MTLAVDTASQYTAELNEEDLQLIAATLLMVARLIPNGTAQDISRKFLARPICLTSHDVHVICAALTGMSTAIKEDRVLPHREILRACNHATLIIQKLQRGIGG